MLHDNDDTHAVQLPTQARLLGELSGALAAFLDDLKQAGLAERVLVMTFSEFARRVAENASAGTDHGTAAPTFLAGPVRGGVFGDAPRLLDLADGDLKMTTDFRRVYATALADWLAIDPAGALDMSLGTLDVEGLIHRLLWKASMKTNPVKRLLREGKPTFGTWLSLGDLYATRVLARGGFDWLTLDMEHSAIDWSQAAMIFAAIADAGCVPLARVPKGNHDYIKRVLDGGAWGIVCPMIDTVEQAQIAIRAAKYPPLGNRSLGGGMHAMNFATSSGEYFKRANDEILVILQTESPTGVANAEEIYSLPGVDAIFVGPVDLRANMRSRDGREATDAELEEMLARVVAAGKKVGTPTGMHTMDAKAALARAEQGMQFIAIGSELRFMTQRALETIRAVRPELGDKDLARY